SGVRRVHRDAKRLRELRKQQGFSRRALAKAIKEEFHRPIGHNKLAEMESGKEVHPKYWKLVTQFFGGRLGLRTPAQLARIGWEWANTQPIKDPVQERWQRLSATEQ